MFNINPYQEYSNWKGWSSQPFAVCDLPQSRYYDAEMRRIRIAASDVVKVFELGFGNGSFAAYATSRGWVYYGAELDSKLVEQATAMSFNAFLTDSNVDLRNLSKSTFDLVVAFDVLEHLTIDQTIHFLQSAHTILKDGGMVLCRIPSGDSPFGRAVLHGDITHRSTLSSSAILQIAAITSYRVLQISSPSFPILGLGLWRAARRCLLVGIRYLLSRAINILYHDAQPLVLTANLVFALRKESLVLKKDFTYDAQPRATSISETECA